MSEFKENNNMSMEQAIEAKEIQQEIQLGTSIAYVYRVICNISLKSQLETYMRGTEEHIFYKRKEALDFIESRLSDMGKRDYDYKFNVADGSSLLPIYPVINSIFCELVDDCDYAHEKGDENTIEDEIYKEELKKKFPVKEENSLNEQEPFIKSKAKLSI